MLIGLSLSRCIRDVIEGRVLERDVLCIVSGTCAEDNDDWNHLLKLYAGLTWEADPQRAKDIANDLRDKNRIIQPRACGFLPPLVKDDHWIKVEEMY